MSTPTFICGHPREPANMKRIGTSRRTGEAKYGCKTCQRESARASWHRYYSAEAIARAAGGR